MSLVHLFWVDPTNFSQTANAPELALVAIDDTSRPLHFRKVPLRTYKLSVMLCRQTLVLDVSVAITCLFCKAVMDAASPNCKPLL